MPSAKMTIKQSKWASKRLNKMFGMAFDYASRTPPVLVHDQPTLAQVQKEHLAVLAKEYKVRPRNV